MLVSKTVLIFVFCLLFASLALADIFDATEDLEGKVVYCAGDVKRLDCPYGSNYDCTSWPLNLLQFEHKNICFTAGLTACGSFCKGFLAVGSDEIQYFFTAKSIGGGLEKNIVTKIYSCPDPY